MKLDKEIEKLRVKFEGIKDMPKLPDAVFVLDLKKDETCAKEAKIKGISIIGITDTNIDPTIANYPIPANDDAISSVKYILEKVKEAVLNSK
jgi:small subunit ribosomal protein S2